MSVDLQKLSVAKLRRQLRVLGCVIDADDKFTKEELINAINFATKDRLVKELEITDETLQGLAELFTDVKFKVGESVLVLVPQELEKPAAEVGAAPAPKRLYFGIHRKPVRKIEDLPNGKKKVYLSEGSTTIIGEEEVDNLIFANAGDDYSFSRRD